MRDQVVSNILFSLKILPPPIPLLSFIIPFMLRDHARIDPPFFNFAMLRVDKPVRLLTMSA